jgi:NADPH2 dehydrogenase
MSEVENQIEELNNRNMILEQENKELKDKLPDISLLKETVNSHRNSQEYGVNPDSRVWKPVKVGPYQLEHRIAMAPLTRMRSVEGVPKDICAEYYKQRATKGGLLISEATFIAREAGGYPHAPVIETKEQVEGWKKVTAAVHEKGGLISCQLWAIGRANFGDMPDVKIVSSSTLETRRGHIPEQMTVDDIKRYLKHYRNAALNAIEAGFDLVEVHGAHGYLLEQFLRPDINCTRDDEYCGPVENRARFMLEALEEVVNAVGAERTAIRISPFTGEEGVDPYEHWGYVVEQIRERFPKLAYLSMTDPRLDPDGTKQFSSDYFRAILRGYKGPISKLFAEEHVRFDEPNEEYPTLFLSAGGYTASDAEPCGDRTGDLIGYGRIYISNPDLVHRLKNGLVMNPYDRATFYARDEQGYLDYPFADENTPKFVPISKRPINDVLKELQDSHDRFMNDLVTTKNDYLKLRDQTKKDEEEKAKEITDTKAIIENLETEKKELNAEVQGLKSELEKLRVEMQLLKEQVAVEKQPIPRATMETQAAQTTATKPEDSKSNGCICQ